MHSRPFLVSLAAALLLLAACSNDDAGVTTTAASSTAAGVTTTVPTTAAGTTAGRTTATTATGTTRAGGTTTTGGPTTAPAGAMTVRAYYLQGERLATVRREVPRSVATSRAALTSLLAGPTGRDRSFGLTTAIPEGTELLGVDLDGDVLTVDLSGDFDDGGGTASMAARAAQVVFTATQQPTVRAVRFHLDGDPVTSLGGEGLLVEEPQTRRDYEAVSGFIVVEEPGVGDEVVSPVQLAGESNTFEATLLVEVVAPDGTASPPIVITATSGTGTWGTFRGTVPFTVPAGSRFRLEAYDPGGASPGEGPPPVRLVVPLVSG